MTRLLVPMIGLAGLGLAVVALRCKLGLHSPGWQDVTNDPDFPTTIRVCRRCGIQLYQRESRRSAIATPPPVPPHPPWEVHVEAVDWFWPFRWGVQLRSGWLVYGPGEGWRGWLCFTLAGARRKGARELARLEAKEARQAARQAIADAAVGS